MDKFDEKLEITGTPPVEVAFDLGANMGYCIRYRNGNFQSGCIDLNKKTDETKYTKLNKFEDWLEHHHDLIHFKQIYYERVDFAQHTYAAQAHGALKGKLNGFAEKNDIPIKGFAVSTIKKKLTGRGNATKQGMIMYAEQYVGKEIWDDNEADAIGVMKTGRTNMT